MVIHLSVRQTDRQTDRQTALKKDVSKQSQSSGQEVMTPCTQCEEDDKKKTQDAKVGVESDQAVQKILHSKGSLVTCTIFSTVPGLSFLF